MVSGFCNNRSDCRLDTKLYFLVPDGSESKCQSLIKWVNIIVSQKKSSGFFFLFFFFWLRFFFPMCVWTRKVGFLVESLCSFSLSPHPVDKGEMQYWVSWFVMPEVFSTLRLGQNESNLVDDFQPKIVTILYINYHEFPFIVT